MDIDESKINFNELGARLKAYRYVKGLSVDALAEQSGLKPTNITKIESGVQYASMNQHWTIVRTMKISPPWLFLGEGAYDDFRPEWLPETIVRERKPGIRRSPERVDAECGEYTGDPFEFVLAVESFKVKNKKTFPSLTEIYELFLSLGYRKTEQQSIYPYNALKDKNDSTKSQRHIDSSLCKIAATGG